MLFYVWWKTNCTENSFRKCWELFREICTTSMSTFKDVERLSVKELCWTRHNCWVNAAQQTAIKIFPWSFEREKLHLQLCLCMCMCAHLTERKNSSQNTSGMDIGRLGVFISGACLTFKRVLCPHTYKYSFH